MRTQKAAYTPQGVSLRWETHEATGCKMGDSRASPARWCPLSLEGQLKQVTKGADVQVEERADAGQCPQIPLSLGTSYKTQPSRLSRVNVYHFKCLLWMNIKPPKTQVRNQGSWDLLCVCECIPSSLATFRVSVCLSGLRSWSPGCTTTKIITTQIEEFPNTFPIPFYSTVHIYAAS